MRPLFLLCFLFLWNSFSLPAQEKPAFSRLDVFELEWANHPQVSPDGQWVVYQRQGMDIMKDRRTSQLWLLNTNGSFHQKLTSVDGSESNPVWSPTGDRIAYISRTDEGSEIFIYWMNTGQYGRITQLDRSPGGLTWSPDGKTLAFSMLVPAKELSLVSPPPKPKGATWADAPRITTRLKHEADGQGKLEPGFRHFFVVPSEGGTPRQITSGDFNFGQSPQWAPDGRHLIFSANLHPDWEYERNNSEIYKIALADGKIDTLTERQGPDYDPVVSGNKIAYLGYTDKVQTYQINTLTVMNLDGSHKKTIELNLDRNIANLQWHPQKEVLFYTFDDRGDTKIGSVALAVPAPKVLAKQLGGTSIGRPYSGGSYHVGGNGVVVYTHSTPYRPAELALVQGPGKEPLILTSLNNDLTDFRTFGAVEEIWYKSSFDNRDIQGWIVKPPFFEADKSYPLLVENHGGPTSNYGDRFSPEMQLYATAGFVVFYPNPRGSTGYGEEFGNLLYHNYPGEDYLDVMDGVDAVLAKGYTSEDSLFVTGGSAGGIMTAWMIGKNNRFRAAAVVKPVMNWFSKTLTADNYYGYANYRYPGQPWENMEIYMQFSPISLVGNVETPTLVMVGSEDLRTPLSEAKQLYHALKLRKIETALVEIPGASHFIANRPSQLITKIDHIVAWFDRYRRLN